MAKVLLKWRHFAKSGHTGDNVRRREPTKYPPERTTTLANRYYLACGLLCHLVCAQKVVPNLFPDLRRLRDPIHV